MCTVTWRREPGGYALFFNRDELRTRRPASPPEVRTHGRLRCLHPVDGDAGGTWIGVNEAGVTVCVLNHYAADLAPRGDARSSRGHLVIALLACPSAAAVAEECARIDCAEFRPFVLLVLGRDESARSFVYGGGALQAGDAEAVPFLSTSSYRTEDVVRSRRSCFDRILAGRPAASAGEHLALHRSHDPERGPYSICMHRPDAGTVSLTRVDVRPGEVAMTYAPGPPCSAALGQPHSLTTKSP
jgi:hypothetical protein